MSGGAGTNDIANVEGRTAAGAPSVVVVAIERVLHLRVLRGGAHC
jgi:hypothetical protein